jgi:hypothetical protein
MLRPDQNNPGPDPASVQNKFRTLRSLMHMTRYFVQTQINNLFINRAFDGTFLIMANLTKQPSRLMVRVF